MRFVVVSVLLALSLSPCSRGDDVYAALHGTVTDPSGAAVCGAAVTVTNVSTGIAVAAVADREGHYALPRLQAGPIRCGLQPRGWRPSSPRAWF